MAHPLHFSEVAGPGADRTAFVLHGILGAGNNWRSFARALVERCPRWRLVLVDLRCHGDSGLAPPPHTVTACADDLVALAARIGAPERVLGHSFGGKVALRYGELEAPDEVWVFDATPSAWPPDKADESDVARVIRSLRQIPLPLARREDLVERMTAMGFGPMLTGWMTTNLRRGPAGLTWKFDLDAVEELLGDYMSLDMRPWLDDPWRSTRVHLVRAALSDRWRPEELTWLEDRADEERLWLHTLADAGHWLHVDNPKGLLDLVARYL